ncbi:CBM_collapsed_G0053990.mRNA.1.CDS.1 [Saccharomyces cerevisiae]|nr:CBM_collapsed_G0053990.mRNA.1.CDS.1 [Saccharomyces cerevisiae]
MASVMSNNNNNNNNNNASYMFTSPLSNTGGGLINEIKDAINEMEQLKVLELKQICKSLDLSITGKKAVLQDRIKQFLRKSCDIGHIDPWRPKAIKILIAKVRINSSLPKYSTLWETLKTGAFKHPVASGQLPVTALQSTALPPYSQQQALAYSFTSPFYKPIVQIPDANKKLKQSAGRGCTKMKFKVSKPNHDLLKSNKSYKLYLFSGFSIPFIYETVGHEAIDFPYPCELVFNGTKLEDNVKGLKKQNGTGNPANLTPYLKVPTEMNHLDLHYLNIDKEYSISCFIVEVFSPEALLGKILKRPKIIKQATTAYIKRTLNEQDDDDIITTSTVLSLQCPISCTRMKYPAKTDQCKHIQCFDALWFLHSQSQVPTWQCPICQHPIKFDQLKISEFVDNIIQNCNEDVEQVEISVDGSWKPIHNSSAVITDTVNQNHSVKNENQGTVKQEQDYDSRNAFDTNLRNGSNHNEPEIISLDSSDDEAFIPASKSFPTHVNPRNDQLRADIFPSESEGSSDYNPNHTSTPKGSPTMDQDNYQDAFQMRSFLNQGATTNINDTPTNNSSINSFVTATNGDSRIFYNRGPSTPLLPAVLQNLTNQTEAQRNPYGPNYNTTAQDRNFWESKVICLQSPLWTQIQKQKLNYQQGPHRRHISLHIYTVSTSGHGDDGKIRKRRHSNVSIYIPKNPYATLMKRRPQANHAIMNKTLAQTNDFNTSAQDNSEVVDLTSD